jgi:hypothetical protein
VVRLEKTALSAGSSSAQAAFPYSAGWRPSRLFVFVAAQNSGVSTNTALNASFWAGAGDWPRAITGVIERTNTQIINRTKAESVVGAIGQLNLEEATIPIRMK